MAKKLLKGVGKLVGIGGKKKAAEPAATPAEQKGPIVTPLAGGGMDPRRRTGPRRGVYQTIIGDKLG